ncbi:hypothetical protein RF11_07167 [Thelohanellus kitauei]|uniref:Uncharacterized protein n=1 Tax=Thelohanellus kitauei TaxID=669202 RepID=A0A0C2J539_THEKT|nr:hypothetical protein RF11_07167 [Thelohanellus kitauei]
MVPISYSPMLCLRNCGTLNIYIFRYPLKSLHLAFAGSFNIIFNNVLAMEKDSKTIEDVSKCLGINLIFHIDFILSLHRTIGIHSRVDFKSDRPDPETLILEKNVFIIYDLKLYSLK